MVIFQAGACQYVKGNLSIIIFARVPVHNWIFVAILVFSFSYLYIVYIIETKSTF